MAQANDESGKGHHMDLNAGSAPVTWDSDVPAGFSGQSLQFATQAYGDIGQITALDGAANASWAFWVKDNWVAGNRRGPFITHNSTVARGWFIGGLFRSGGGAMEFVAPQTPGLVNNTYTAAKYFMISDAWTHVVIVYDGAGATNPDKVKMYEDGIARPVTFEIWTFASVLDANNQADGLGVTQNTYIGSSPDSGTPGYMTGNLFDMRMYTSSLSANNVTYLHTQGASGDDPGNSNLEGYWAPASVPGGSTPTLPVQSACISFRNRRWTPVPY